MPFRFRKIISFGKGFRLNLSKSGVSSTIGSGGLHLNIGKRGFRTTVSAPGTGLSFTPSLGNQSGEADAKSGSGIMDILSNIPALIISGILVCLISACCIGVIFFGGDIDPTPTTQPIPIGTTIAETSSAARMQTIEIESPTSTQFIYETPTMLPPVTLVPSFTPWASATPFNYSSELPVIAPPVQPPSSGSSACSCGGDTYNCSDFSSRAEAQACFDACISEGAGDIHMLDEDGDNDPCESLP